MALCVMQRRRRRLSSRECDNRLIKALRINKIYEHVVNFNHLKALILSCPPLHVHHTTSELKGQDSSDSPLKIAKSLVSILTYYDPQTAMHSILLEIAPHPLPAWSLCLHLSGPVLPALHVLQKLLPGVEAEVAGGAVEVARGHPEHGVVPIVLAADQLVADDGSGGLA